LCDPTATEDLYCKVDDTKNFYIIYTRSMTYDIYDLSIVRLGFYKRRSHLIHANKLKNMW